MLKKTPALGENDWPVVIISGGILLVFVFFSILNAEGVSHFVNVTFGWAVTYFGAFWQMLLLGTFLVALYLAFSKYGKVKLGEMERPEFSNFKWISIIMCTLLAGGGVFWAAAEPIYHFMELPPIFSGIESGSPEAASPALAQSFLHWGFLAWAILGTLSTIVLMYAHYQKGMPLKPRSLLYPIFGEKIARNSPLGTTVDVCSVVAVAAGTIGPIGFLGLQAGYGFETLLGIPNEFPIQLAIVIGLVVIASISAVTGIHRGIQILSRYNVWFTIGLIIFILLIGPGGFIINSFISSFGFYVQDFARMTTFRGDGEWLGLWTVFFWGWFLGYGPMMAIFITRISRGRTIRQLILAIAIIAPLVTNFWFTIVGGSGIFYEINNPGSVSNALFESGLPASMIAIVQQLPLGTFIAFCFLIVTILFVVTTTDSMSYTISLVVSGNNDPHPYVRVFWAVTMGAVAASLLFIGEGSVNAIQSFIVVTAVPVSLILLPTLWLAPQTAKKMAIQQGVITIAEKKQISKEAEVLRQTK
ncbi:BCCT family transporter [Alkalicoccus halolimnae]|uniref:BCCT family transporter n=1 Tax=Alkalicoccus halolimnae TaxID=1667239 RepID=A0A5C7FIT3_9BACI|nr:BCCT family transporter [Alkalicoccus halolimnae]TXF85326.1 BCCT family transporter [Alkalicoccus halolimnae]